jgi:polyisoprenoid-binding protein YceI
MQNVRFSKAFAVLSLCLGMAVTGQAAEKKAAATQTFTVDTTKSVATWKGTKVTGFHVGHINVKDGSLTTTGKELSSGTVSIDMTSITDDDMKKDDPYNAKLITHLKSPDFFSAEKFPTATLKITKVEKKASGANTHEVTGDLTIKGVTNPVTFPLKITHKDGVLSASGTVTIDRTKYDIRYGSGKFFQNLGDKLIHDKFMVSFDLVANAAK